MTRRLVIALGGNALGSTPKEQLELVKKTASTIVDLREEGYDVIIGHGNGPQVGMINLAFEFAHKHQADTPAMPFAECGAMTQGYIGYHLQQAIQAELEQRNRNIPVASVVTQVEVNPNDPAFKSPVKPIGMFYTKEEADSFRRENGYTFMEDAKRGYRRVVASPLPVSIVELPVIEQLVDSHNIVITVGGGGIPVVKDTYGYHGVPAVIDKDRACAKLALDLKADMLVILTTVEKVSINYRKENQEDLSELTVKEAEEYMAQGQFAPGSMLPKVESCLSFLKGNPNGCALITSLEKAKEALEGKTGTRITL